MSEQTPRIGQISLTGGRYDRSRDSIFVKVEDFDLQHGDELEFKREFFEHPTLFGQSSGTQIADAIHKASKAIIVPLNRIAKSLEKQRVRR